MRVNGGVAGCSGEIFVVPVSDMIVGFVKVFFSEAKVNHVHFVHVVSFSNEKIVGLDVSVEDASGMDVLDEFEHLPSYQDCGFEGEFSATEVEEIFQTVAEQVHDHDVAISFLANGVHIGNVDLIVDFLGLKKVDDKTRFVY